MGSAGTFDIQGDSEIEIRRKIIDQCLVEGVTLLDTSPMYGRAEEVLGITIAGRREKFHLATKVWCSGAETGKSQIARSFSLLKTDHIELIQKPLFDNYLKPLEKKELGTCSDEYNFRIYGDY